MAQPIRGSIVWAKVLDPQGQNLKLRPLVIVTATEEIPTSSEVWAVAVSTQLDDTPTEDCVELPWQRPRHPKTGLNERCAAVCTWLKKIPLSSIEEYAGVVPGKQLLAILAKVGDLPP